MINGLNKKIVIVGAGGLGREIYSWLMGAGLQDKIVGFIDDNLSALDGYGFSEGIYSDIGNYVPKEGVLHILAIMNPEAKRKVVAVLKAKFCEFMTLVSPSVIMGKDIELGEGVIITPGCILTCDINVGDFVFINTQSTLGHDVNVGEYTSINSKVEVSGFVHIGTDVLVGSRSVILPDKRIASGAIIGAGSVVVGNINRAMTVFGNPAKRLG